VVAEKRNGGNLAANKKKNHGAVSALELFNLLLNRDNKNPMRRSLCGTCSISWLVWRLVIVPAVGVCLLVRLLVVDDVIEGFLLAERHYQIGSETMT
jgi:hypothetical protein